MEYKNKLLDEIEKINSSLPKDKKIEAYKIDDEDGEAFVINHPDYKKGEYYKIYGSSLNDTKNKLKLDNEDFKYLYESVLKDKKLQNKK